MFTDLERAKQLLKKHAATCVLCKGNVQYRSSLRGVAPLMEFWKKGTCLTGFSAADKVVGKATALLYCLLQVRAVYALIMSEPALQVLQEHGIFARYNQLVPAIQNRTGDGFCPMETATAHISDPADAPQAIEDALNRLRSTIDS